MCYETLEPLRQLGPIKHGNIPQNAGEEESVARGDAPRPQETSSRDSGTARRGTSWRLRGREDGAERGREAGGRGDERTQRQEVRAGEPRRRLQRLSQRRTRHLASMTPCPGCCSDPELRVRGEQSIALLFRPASRWTLEQVNRERTRVTVNEIQKFAGHLNCFFLPH